MNRKLLHYTMGGLAGLAALALAGPAQAQNKVRMVFGAPLTTLHLPMIAAEELGYFKDAGVTLEKVFLAGDANALRAVLAGDAELCGTGMFTLISAAASGADVRGVFSYQPVADYNIIVKDAKIGLKDLGGKSFASSGPLDMTTEIPKMVMRKNGVDPTSVNFVQIGGHSARLQSVIAGKVDASMVNTFTATLGAKDNQVKVLTSVASVVPNIGYSIAVSSKASLANPQKRKDIEAIAAGIIKGARFVMKEPDRAAEMMNKISSDMSVDILKKVIPQLNEDKVWGANGGVERPVVEFTAQMAKDMGTVNKIVAYEDLIDPTVVEAALKRVGTE